MADYAHNLAEDHVQSPQPAHRLTSVVRHITTTNAQGDSVFLPTDIGDHRLELFNQSAVANILYCTKQVPVDLDDEVDVDYVRKTKPSMAVSHGTVCSMVDFAPGGVSPMQSSHTMDLAVVIEGVFKLVLSSGEERVMQRGDVAIQRATSQKWINVTGNGLLPARVLFVLHDVENTNTGELEIDTRQNEIRSGGFGKDNFVLASHVASLTLKDGNYYESELQ
ncbi:unnamed protein product [Discula destructiva]